MKVKFNIMMMIIIMVTVMVMMIPVDVISTLDLPRGKKGCAAYKKLSCQYLDSSLSLSLCITKLKVKVKVESISV